MDTRDQSPSKLTRLHDRSHPTHHRPASLWIDYSRTMKSFMELEREEGWWWRWRRFPLSGAQNGLQICPPDEEQDVAAPRIANATKSSLLIFFLGESEFIELNLGAVEPRGPHKLASHHQGVAATWLVAHWPIPSGGSLRRYFSYFPEIFSVNFQDVPRTFISAQKQHHGNSAEKSVSLG